MVREITLAHTPETPQAAAEAVATAQKAVAVAQNLKRILTTRSDPKSLYMLADAHTVLAAYARAARDLKEALQESQSR